MASSTRSSATYKRESSNTYNPSTGRVITSYPSGKRILTAKVTINGYSYEMTKEVNLIPLQDTKIKLPAISSSTLAPGSTLNLSIENPIDGPTDSIKWFIYGSAMNDTVRLFGRQIKASPDKVGIMNVSLIDKNGCAPYNETVKSFSINQVAIIIPHNPASGTADFSVVLRSDGTLDGSGDVAAMSPKSYNSISGCYEEPYLGTYRIELWHKQSGMVRSVDMPAGSPDSQINVSDLSAGDYIVRLIIDGNLVDVTQLRVQ